MNEIYSSATVRANVRTESKTLSPTVSAYSSRTFCVMYNVVGPKYKQTTGVPTGRFRTADDFALRNFCMHSDGSMPSRRLDGLLRRKRVSWAFTKCGTSMCAYHIICITDADHVPWWVQPRGFPTICYTVWQCMCSAYIQNTAWGIPIGVSSCHVLFQKTCKCKFPPFGVRWTETSRVQKDHMD